MTGWRYTGGHHHFTYGSDEQQGEERTEAMAERWFGQPSA